jgi:uncharacterized protein YqjF (DUF2071 family)
MIDIPASQLLQYTKHRPFPLPDKPWFIYQQWKDVLFLHSPVKPDVLRPLLPADLALDITSGYAWVSIVVFAITESRMRLFSMVPLLPAFNELNLRTYVVRDKIPGIYFLQIKANSERAVLMNRMMTKLRYRYADIRKTASLHYFMTEKSNNILDIDFRPGPYFNEVPTLDRWLTERYCCYQDDGPAMYRYHIHHPVWPLYQVETNYQLLRFDLPDWQLTDQSIHLLHYSPLQSTLIWRRERIT